MTPRFLLAAVLLSACSASSPSPQANVDPDLVGTWLATAGDPPGVVAVFDGSGGFTWSNGDLRGTYEADGSTLTFTFPQDDAFCPAGTLIWRYDVTDDMLTSDAVRIDCTDGEPIDERPPSPDWIFERQ